jgi:hypothetical protein
MDFAPQSALAENGLCLCQRNRVEPPLVEMRRVSSGNQTCCQGLSARPGDPFQPKLEGGQEAILSRKNSRQRTRLARNAANYLFAYQLDTSLFGIL